MAIQAKATRTHACRGGGGSGGMRKGRRLICRVGKKSAKKEQEFVVGGGGFDGACEIDDIKAALENCRGLEGPVLEACWAEYGCSVEKVTKHYAKVAGFEVRSEPNQATSEESSDT